MKRVEEIVIDHTHRIISTPCYMMNASIAQVQIGIEKACQALVEMIQAA
jgi:enhancing lycopene biosynthesis protein 2